MTACFGLLRPTEHTLAFLSAGQGPLVKYIRADDKIVQLGAHGLPLGIMPDVQWEQPEIFEMKPGDMMILVTDGFFEWADSHQKQFGMDRLVAVIRENRDRPSRDIILRLHEAVLAFVGDKPQDDDLTAVIVKRC